MVAAVAKDCLELNQIFLREQDHPYSHFEKGIISCCMTIIDTMLFIYVAACVGVIWFQFALIAGAPWGHLTQGGQQHGSLPTKNRIAACISVIILAGMALAIASAAGSWPLWPSWTAWAALAVQFVVTLLNWITPSKPERQLWGPITTTMLLLAATVVFTA